MTAHVSYGNCLGSTGESYLQNAEVQAGSGKRHGQRRVDGGGIDDFTAHTGSTKAAVRQCPSARKQGCGMIRLRAAQACRRRKLSCALVVNLGRRGGDITGTILPAADGLPLASRHQNSSVGEQG